MIIKLIAGNVCHSAIVSFTEDELSQLGLSGDRLSLQNRPTRLLMNGIFKALEKWCGLSRDGHFVTVACRPFRQGGCRFRVEFTRQPSARLYEFRCADDMLDAANQLLLGQPPFDIFHAEIQQRGEGFALYIPAEYSPCPAAAAILSEYAL